MPSIIKSSTLHLLLLWCLIIAAKLWHQQADADALNFLLAPTAKGSSLLLGLDFGLSTEGYYSQQASFLISRDCSGFNFWLIATLAGFLALMPRWKSAYRLIPAAVLLGYALTLLANVARICCLVLAGSFIQVPMELHLAIGVAVYLGLLIPYFLLLSKPLKLLSYASQTR